MSFMSMTEEPQGIFRAAPQKSTNDASGTRHTFSRLLQVD
jgi:hypothetical protein